MPAVDRFELLTSGVLEAVSFYAWMIRVEEGSVDVEAK